LQFAVAVTDEFIGLVRNSKRNAFFNGMLIFPLSPHHFQSCGKRATFGRR
jgi:hypothetical protein